MVSYREGIVRPLLVFISIAIVPSVPQAAQAFNPAQWSLSISTSGNDVFWTSPSAVDLGLPRYLASYEITRVEAFTAFGGTDVTSQLDETSGSGSFDFLPATLVNDSLSEPTTGTAATINVGIDASGFGQASITDVTLGTLIVLPITQIDVDATVTVHGIVPGDFDVDLDVDTSDFSQWESSFGVSSGADSDTDGDSDGFDLLEWQRFFGSSYSTSLTIPVSVVPEPSLLSGLTLVSLVLLTTRFPRLPRST